MPTTYTLTGNGSLRDIGNAAIFGVATARTGGDIFNLSGFSLTIDQDTRYGLSGNNSTATAATTLGNITVDAAKGGTLNIDARYVRMIPFTGGSGTITAGTLITCGSATAKVIGLYSAINVAPVLTGVATGWIKVTEWNSIAFPTSGAFTQAGYTFTISGADTAGFIELTGDEASTITANRLGTVNINGEWFDVGTTTGVSTSTYQLPTNGSIQYYPAVWVETGVGTGIFESYPSAGSLVAAASIATDARGKVCWTTTAGLLRLGHDGTNITGFLPAAGLRIRIPNILTNSCLATARNVNALPNATLATRYDFTTTGGGVVNIDKALLNWYPSFAQAFSVSLTNVGIAEQLALSEIAQPMTHSNVVVGQSAAQAQVALTMSLCYAGGTFTDCNWTRATLAAATAFTGSVTDCYNFTFTNNKSTGLVVKTNATAGTWSLTRAVNCFWVNNTMIGGMATIVACTNVWFTNTHYADVVKGVTATTAAQNNYVWSLVSANSSGLKFDGLDFMGILNIAPYLSLLNIGIAGCSNIKLRNIGTYAVPLALGTATVFTGSLITVISGASAANVKLQRIYCANTRLNGIYFTSATSPDNSSTDFVLENVFTDYADNADLGNILNLKRKGIGGIPSVAAAVSIYGTHFLDCHTSTTAGRLAILMNESTASTSSQVSLANGAAFTSAGGLYMPTIGMSATFETPDYLIGHTGFSATAGTMAGGTVGNYNFNFSIDKNDGAGWSTMTTANYTAATLATAMNALTGINALNGWKLRLKITTTVTNTTAITSFFMLTTSTTTTQAYQYPLESNTVTFTGLPAGCDAVTLLAGTGTILDSKDSMAGTSYSFTYSGAQTVDVGFIKPGYVPFYIRNLALTAVDSSIPVSLTFDRNYA